jgi:replication initiation and membrane attachment protein
MDKQINQDPVDSSATKMAEQEKILLFYETHAPDQLLEIRSGGGKPAKIDLKIIKELQSNLELPDPVINVLIDFVLYTQDMKLYKPLIIPIAREWSRKEVRTVKEAMKLAVSELKKREIS